MQEFVAGNWEEISTRLAQLNPRNYRVQTKGRQMDQEIQNVIAVNKQLRDFAISGLRADVNRASDDLTHRFIELERKVDELLNLRTQLYSTIAKQRDIIEKLEQRLEDVNNVFSWENVILNEVNT